MDEDQTQHLIKMRQAHLNLLRTLELQAANFGIHVPAHILMEIDDLRGKIAKLDQRLGSGLLTANFEEMIEPPILSNITTKSDFPSGEISAIYLFVSYASQDRNRTLPVVDRLSDLGIRFWIDRNQVADGADYAQEISSAINMSSGMVVFLSRHTYASNSVKKALKIAWKKGKRVILLILEEINIPNNFLYNLEVKSITLFAMTEEQWIQEIRQTLRTWKVNFDVSAAERDVYELNTRATSMADIRTADIEMAATPVVPYLINRIQQEWELREAINKHHQQNSRRPLLFLVYARTEQAIHEYMTRVKTASLPQTLRRLEYADVVKWVNLPWVPTTDRQNDLEHTLRNLCEDVEAKLKLKPGAWPGELPQVAADLRATLVFCYHLRWAFWTSTLMETLSAWALEWGRLPDLPLGNQMIIFFVIEYAPTTPSILQRILGRSQSEHPIRKQLDRLLAVDGHGLTVRLLPELGNVTLQDVDDWILDVVKPSDQAYMIRLAQDILKDPDLCTQSGVPMNRLFARDLANLIEEVGRRAV